MGLTFAAKREFQVITSGGIAEFGRASSGIINVVSQSGANEWRGRAYGFLRSRRMDARNPLSMRPDPRDPSRLLKDPRGLRYLFFCLTFFCWLFVPVSGKRLKPLIMKSGLNVIETPCPKGTDF
jgi:hypothetical protein